MRFRDGKAPPDLKAAISDIEREATNLAAWASGAGQSHLRTRYLQWVRGMEASIRACLADVPVDQFLTRRFEMIQMDQVPSEELWAVVESDRDAQLGWLKEASGEVVRVWDTNTSEDAGRVAAPGTRRGRFAWSMPTGGDLVGGRRLLRTLGEGGNSIVWLAQATEGEVALKILKPPERSERYDRFAQEVQVHLEVLGDREGVLPTTDAYLPTGDPITDPPWLAMPVAQSLADHLGDQPSVEDVVSCAIEIGSTLHGLVEEYGVSHRDIKPSNLFWWDNRPCVGDFGLVSVPGGPDITRDDRDLGPREFLAPEMRANRPNREGPPADVFNLALTIFHLLGGDPPRDGLRSDEESHQLSTILSNSAVRDLDNILQRATRFSADQRPSMGEFVEELRAWLHPPGSNHVGVEIGAARRQIGALVVPMQATEVPGVRRESLERFQARVDEMARPTLSLLEGLDLVRTSAAVRLFERLDPCGLEDLEGSSVALERSGADGAVWVAGGIGIGRTTESFVLLAGWAVASHDHMPELWVETRTVDPESQLAITEANDLIGSWNRQFQWEFQKYIAAMNDWAAAASDTWKGTDVSPPELLDFRLYKRNVGSHGRIEVKAVARLRDLVSGLAGTGREPSQARLVGRHDEFVDLTFSADADRVCGTRHDGWYEGTAVLEPFHHHGRWSISQVVLNDQAGHTERMSPDDLSDSGFDTEIDLGPRAVS